MDCAHLEWASNWNTMKCTGCSKTRNEIDLEAKLSALMVEYDQLLSDNFIKTAELKDTIISMRCCGNCANYHEFSRTCKISKRSKFAEVLRCGAWEAKQ